MDFQFGHKKHVKDTETLVRLMNHDGSTRLRTREKLGVIDTERSSVTHVNRERPEGSGTVDVFELFNGHDDILPRVGRCHITFLCARVGITCWGLVRVYRSKYSAVSGNYFRPSVPVSRPPFRVFPYFSTLASQPS